MWEEGRQVHMYVSVERSFLWNVQAQAEDRRTATGNFSIPGIKFICRNLEISTTYTLVALRKLLACIQNTKVFRDCPQMSDSQPRYRLRSQPCRGKEEGGYTCGYMADLLTSSLPIQ